jgi:hypothetical protein
LPTFNQRMDLAEEAAKPQRVHIEYPKRVYPLHSKKGVTVHSAGEEDQVMRPARLAQRIAAKAAPTAPPVPVAAPPAVVIDPEVEAKANEALAIDYLIGKGYNKKEAKQMVSEEGVDSILLAKDNEAKADSDQQGESGEGSNTETENAQQ